MRKILKLLILFVTVSFSSSVSALNSNGFYTPDEIPDSSYIIGTHLFTDPENDIYDTTNASNAVYDGNVMYVRTLMLGATSINSDNYSNMVVYYKDFFGDWADGISGAEVNVPESFNIKYVNGICVIAGGCNNPSSGGSSGEIVTATFYYLDEQGNTKYDSFNVSKGDYLDAAMVPVIPERRGIKFDKWTYVNPENDKVEPFSLSSTINNDIEITATYSTIDYHISYDLNGGLIDGSDVFPEEAICNFADGFNSSNCETTDKVPEKRGYTFAGWTIESLTNSSSDTYPLIGSEEDIGELLVPELDGTTDIVLYAVWKLNSYEIQYELNDGFYLTANVAGNYNVENTINFATPTKQGFTFEGWYTTSSFDEGTNIESTENRIGKLSVYAKWSINKANLTYKDYDGTVIEDDIECVYDNCTIKQQNPTREGYTFLYWLGSDGIKYYNGNIINNDSIISNNGGEILLTAVYNTGDEYPIEYDLDGGSLSSDFVDSYNYIEGIRIPIPIPSKIGFIFQGYTVTTGDATIAKVNNGYLLTVNAPGEIVLRAQFDEIKHYVTYMDGGNKLDEVECTYNSCIVNREAQSQDGKTFQYWLGNNGYIYKTNQRIYNLTSDVILTSVFNDGDSYSINYDLNGGEFKQDNYVQAYTYGRVTNLPIPERAGYIFAGWLDDEDNIHDFIASTEVGDKTLTAKWETKNINVNYYYHNENNDDIPGYACNSNSSECLSPEEPTREGYRFLGWSLTADGNDSLISANADYHSLLHGNNTSLALHAIWTPVISNITYNFGSQDATLVGNIATTISYEDVVSLPNATRDGYDFGGWYQNALLTGEPISELSNVKNNVTIFAKWVPKTFVVTYHNTDNVIVKTDTCTYNDCEVSDALVSPAGYAFKYWADLDNGTIYSPGSNIVGVFEDISLTAVFEDTRTYDINYDLDGGTNPRNAINEYMEKVGTNLPVPTKDGYDFDGWVDIDNGETPVTEITSTDARDFNLLATWTQKKYKVSYIVGEEITSSNEVNYGRYTLVSKPTQERDFCTFKSWVDVVANTEYDEGIEIDLRKDTVFVAKWECKDTATLEYQLEGGHFTNTSLSTNNVYTVGTLVTLPKDTDIVKDGYNFLGWSLGEATFTDEITISSNTVLKAIWSEKNYNIDYKVDDTIIDSSVCSSTNENCSIKSDLNPISGNSKFMYWVNNGVMYDESSKFKLSGDMVLTAVFDDAVTYPITYNIGDATFKLPVAPSYVYGEGTTYALPQDSDVYLEGKELVGWYLDGTNIGFNIPSDVEPGPIELDPVWETKKYNITYYTDSSLTTMIGDSETKNYGESFNIRNYDNTEIGHLFVLWISSDGYYYSASETVTMPARDVKLYPLVIDGNVSFSINYHYDKGTPNGELASSYSVGETFTLGTLSEDGYDFLGWTTTEDGTDYVTSVDGFTENLDLYAHFIEKNYVVNYRSADGTKVIESIEKRYKEDNVIGIKDNDGERIYAWSSEIAPEVDNREPEYRYDYNFANLDSYRSEINLYAIPSGNLQIITVNATYTPTKNGEGFEAGSVTSSLDMAAGNSIANGILFMAGQDEGEMVQIKFKDVESFYDTKYGNLTWYSDAAYTQVVDINEIVDLPLTEDGFTINIYAKEEAKNFDIVLHTSDGNNVIDTITKKFGEENKME